MRDEPLGRVVVGVDGSPTSMAAVDLAAEEAACRLVPLLIVHAASEPPMPTDRVQRLLDVAVSEALADHPSITVTAEALPGAPVPALVQRSRGACLLVLGQRRNGTSERSADSVANGVARQATVPVMIRRPLDSTAPTVDEPWPVLVAVAGRPGDDQVVEFAFDEAALRGAPLRAVHIWPTGRAGRTAALHGFADTRDAADQMLVDVLRPWSEKYPEVAVHRVVRHGLDVPVALVAASRSAQLIVVGSSRPDAARQARPWAVEALIQRGSCSVVVVPTD
jgi:nucleotide-binding universal stress UspA family protein